MKRTILCLFVAFASSFAFADTQGDHPCKTVQNSCIAAGYTKGHHKTDKKGLFADCMKPLMNGQTVAGVNVDSAAIQACQAKRASRKAH